MCWPVPAGSDGMRAYVILDRFAHDIAGLGGAVLQLSRPVVRSGSLVAGPVGAARCHSRPCRRAMAGRQLLRVRRFLSWLPDHARHDQTMSPDKRSRRNAKTKASKPVIVRTKPSADDAHDLAYFVREDGSSPAREFVNGLPSSPRVQMRACLTAVAGAPPKRFAGGGYWEAMHGEMTGWFEVRIDTALAGGAGTIHHRLFCRLDYEAEGRDRPLLVAITGMSKPFKTTFSDSDYEKVRAMGEEYFAKNPRSIF